MIVGKQNKGMGVIGTLWALVGIVLWAYMKPSLKARAQKVTFFFAFPPPATREQNTFGGLQIAYIVSIFRTANRHNVTPTAR